MPPARKTTEKEQTTDIIVYPTTPDKEGYFFENEYDHDSEIQTLIYKNGNKIKQTLLPGCNKQAIVRELLGKDTKEIARFMGTDHERYQMASITIATTVDANKQPIEFFENLKMKDFQRLLTMYQSLNF